MSPFRLSAKTFILEVPYRSPAFSSLSFSLSLSLSLSLSFLYVEALFLTSNSRLLSELPASSLFLFLSLFFHSFYSYSGIFSFTLPEIWNAMPSDEQDELICYS